jgi:hypothetical protein
MVVQEKQEEESSEKKATTMNELLYEEAKKSVGNVAFSIAVITGGAFSIAAVSVKTTAGVIYYVTQKINRVLDRKLEEQQQKTNAYNAMSDKRQNEVLVDDIEKETVRAVKIMKDAQENYLKYQDKFIRDCIHVLMMRTCKRGHLYGFTCDRNGVAANLTHDLNMLTGESKASLYKLNALESEIKTALSTEKNANLKKTDLNELKEICLSKMTELLRRAQGICYSVYDQYTDLGNRVHYELVEARKMNRANEGNKSQVHNDSAAIVEDAAAVHAAAEDASTLNVAEDAAAEDAAVEDAAAEDAATSEEQKAGKRRNKSRRRRSTKRSRKHTGNKGSRKRSTRKKRHFKMRDLETEHSDLETEHSDVSF